VVIVVIVALGVAFGAAWVLVELALLAGVERPAVAPTRLLSLAGGGLVAHGREGNFSAHRGSNAHRRRMGTRLAVP
jgi:hypothetical protein